MDTTNTSSDAAADFASAELWFVRSSSALTHVRVHIPTDHVADWKALFANGSSAQVVYSSETDAFLILPTLTPSASLPPSSSSSSSSCIKLPPTLLIAAAALVVTIVFATCIRLALARQRARQQSGATPHVATSTMTTTGFLTSILASARSHRKWSASPSLLEDRWSEWSTSSRNVVSEMQTSKRATMGSNALLSSAQVTPKREHLVIYELGADSHS